MKFRTLALAAALAFGGAAIAAPNDTAKIRGGSELSHTVKVKHHHATKHAVRHHNKAVRHAVKKHHKARHVAKRHHMHHGRIATRHPVGQAPIAAARAFGMGHQFGHSRQ